MQFVIIDQKKEKKSSKYNDHNHDIKQDKEKEEEESVRFELLRCLIKVHVSTAFYITDA